MNEGLGLEGDFCFVPKLEMSFVICPSVHECVSIGHDIVSLVAVNIHPVFHFAVALIHLCKPPLSR